MAVINNITRFKLYIYWGLAFYLDLYYNKVKSRETKKIENSPTKVCFLSVQKTMIILRHTNINLSKIECSCGHHDWTTHYQYKRYIDFFGLKLRIKINRIRCLHCGKTHAILIENMIPYSCINQEDVITLFTKDNTSDQSSYIHFLKSIFTLSLLNDYCSLCIAVSRMFKVIFIST